MGYNSAARAWQRTSKTVPMAADYFNDIERGEGFLDPSSKELRGIHQTLRADPLRVVIADEDRLFVEGVSSLLDGWDEFKLVGKAYTLEDAFSLVIRLNPPVILMGAAMNGVPCAETVSKICEKNPQTRVMILASSGESGLVLDALRAGARGFGSREELTSDRLRALVWALACGDIAFPGLLARNCKERCSGKVGQRRGTCKTGGTFLRWTSGKSRFSLCSKKDARIPKSALAFT